MVKEPDARPVQDEANILTCESKSQLQYESITRSEISDNTICPRKVGADEIPFYLHNSSGLLKFKGGKLRRDGSICCTQKAL